MPLMHADPTEDIELEEEGDEDELAVNSETGELLDSDVERPLDSTTEGEPYSACPDGVHYPRVYHCTPVLHCLPCIAMPVAKAMEILCSRRLT